MAEVEDVTCLICAFPFEANQRVRCVGVCGHDNVCSICFLRLRSIQRTFTCASCKQQLDHVICSTTVGAQFSDFTIWGDNIGPDYIYDEKSQMFFPKAYHKSKVETLWAFKCGVCKQTRRDMKQLKQHYQAEHNLHMCELCIENKQSFPSEQKVYKQVEYENHLRKGDQDGSEGHPKCEFCRKRYYDKTGLFMHLSRDHFSCHLCDRAGIQFKYFSDYKHLEDHFRTGHHICEDPVCLAKRFVVFTNGIDLAAHSLSFHPFMQTRRSIPIHFKVRRPQNVEEKEVDEDDEMLSRDTGARSTGAGTGGHFEGGMGGRARGGEWQVELPPSARDPRDAVRASQAAIEPASFVTAGRAFADTLEEYPALAKAGGGALTIGGWGNISNNNGKKPDFPALGPGPGAGLKGQGVAGGGNGGRSFSGAATGSFIRDGKVGGGGVQPAGDDSWAISTKKEKRLKPSGGISKPDSNGWAKHEEDAPVNLKGPDYPQLSLGPKGYRKEVGSTPGPTPVRTQPQYSSLAVLSRDDSVSYKVEGSGSGNSVRGAVFMGDEDDRAGSDLEDREAAEMALALAQIERLESGAPIEAENAVKVVEIAKKKEKKVLKKSTAAAPVDGWGSAFKAVGIGAPNKKPGKGLSLAKPFKKVTSSTSSDSIVGLGLGVKEAAVAPSRSFDDLKQMGRLHRDYEDQLQYSEKTSDALDYTKKEREKEIQKAFCADDFPALNTTPPVPGSAIGLGYQRKDDNSSSTGDSFFPGNTSPPPPPPGLSVEQRNENIRAFVAESKLRQAASSSSLSSSDFLGGNGDGVRADPSNSTTQSNGNWTKMGGVTVPPPASAPASSDYPALGADYQNYTAATPFSFSDSDYPSLGPGPGSSSSGATKKDSKGRPNYSAAAAVSGNGSALTSAKSSEDFLAAKKEKVAKKMLAQIQDLSLK